MPLIVDGKPVSSTFCSFADFSNKNPSFKEKANEFCNRPIQTIKSTGLLYVMQREFSTVSRDDKNVIVIGSGDATTCHIVVLRNTASGLTSLGHFDGYDTSNGIKSMIEAVTSGSVEGSGKIELGLFGGFLDNQGTSEELAVSILEVIQNHHESIHLTSACMVGFNDTIEKGLHKPIVFGVAVGIQDGEIFPATFEDKGPDECIRHARIFTGIKKMTEVYNSRYQELRILPYEYEEDISWMIPFFLSAPDEEVLEHLSSSPHCEPSDFVENTKATLHHILTHPKPLKTIFPGGKPRVHKRRAGNDGWQLV